MPVTSLSFNEVGPFDEVSFEFDKHVNVFIGPNNSGKSTVLWVLGELLVYPFPMRSRLIRSDQATWSLGASINGEREVFEGKLPSDARQLLRLYENVGHTCYIPAQRQATFFRSPGPSMEPDDDARLEEEIEQLMHMRPEIIRQHGRDAVREAWRIGRSEDTPELAKRRQMPISGTLVITDEAVKQKIINLDYESLRLPKPTIRALFNKIATIASEITEGFPLEFDGVGRDSEGLFPQYATRDGDLPLDFLSQGTQSIVNSLAHFLLGFAEYFDFPPDLEDKPGILLIDEIDAHLHPSWQRRIIPALTKNLPNVQIFCSTHSPMALAGLDAGQVHLLRRTGDGKVTATQNEFDIQGWSADEILRQVFEVRNPTDTATADRITRFRELMDKGKRSPEEEREKSQLQKTISDDLLSGPESAQVLRFAEELKRARKGADRLRSGSVTEVAPSDRCDALG